MLRDVNDAYAKSFPGIYKKSYELDEDYNEADKKLKRNSLLKSKLTDE